jgi:hypothetical protein
MGLAKDSPPKSKYLTDIIQNRFFSLVIALLSVGIIGFFLVCKVSEFDIWYHMAVGREILRLGEFPKTDQLSLLNLGQPFHARLWLFRTLAAAGYQAAGSWWLQSVQIVLWGTTFWFVYRSTRIWTSATTAWLMLLFMALASSERFTIRPEIVSYTMIAAYSWRLQQGKFRSFSDLAIFFVLQEIWTNSHGLFSIGPFLVGCYFLEALIKGNSGQDYDARNLGKLLGVTLAGCIITPTGLDTIKYTWLLITTVSPTAPMLNSMFELAPPLGNVSRNFPAFWFFLTLFAAFLVSLLVMTVNRARALPPARTLAGITLLAVAMTGIRNMPLFTIVATPLIAEYLSRLNSAKLRRICLSATTVIVIGAAIVWSPLPALKNLRNEVPYRFGLGMSPDFVPMGLPRFLDRIGFSGPIFNSQTLGGFYEYYGAPGRIPFYDYRLEDFELSRLMAVFSVTYSAHANPAGWNALLQQYDFRGLLLENNSTTETAGMLPLIAADPLWRLVFLDNAASFWIRTDHLQLPPPVGHAEVNDLVMHVANAPQAENIDSFLEKSGLYPDIRMKLLEIACGRWENALFLTNLGILKMQSGKLDEAEQLFKRVLRHKPRSRQTLATLAQIALNRGDVIDAEMYLKKAIGYFPKDQELRDNYALVLKALNK